jgi:phosphatidylglycerol:prolipoprotein diacylglycerol transferase
MFPIFFKLGPVTIYTYGLLVAAGFSTGIVLALYLGKRENLPRENLLDISFYSLAAAIIGSRLLFVLIEYKYFLSRPVEIFRIWEGGLVFYGGLLAVIPVVFIYFKIKSLPPFKFLDVFAPAFALGHAIGRIGCFSAGCCFGKPTELPWGIIFSHPDTMAVTGVTLHPTQLYESAAEFGIFVTLMVMRQNKRFEGQIIGMYVLLYSVARFIIELFRGDPDRGFIYNDFSIAQGISVILVMSSLYFLRSRRNKQMKKQ